MTRCRSVLSPASTGRAATSPVHIFSVRVVAKRLELLRELVPGSSRRSAVLVNPDNASRASSTSRDVQAAARAMGLGSPVLNASTSGDIDAAFTTLVHERAEALFVGTDSVLQQPAPPIVASGGAPCDPCDLSRLAISPQPAA